MRLKARLTDFRVDELIREGYLAARGAHRVYRVTKRKRTSLEAAEVLARLAGVPTAAICMAGLKDRQGVTRQYMSVPHGKQVHYQEGGIGIESAGFADRELTSDESVGNAFEIVVRDLDPRELRRLRSSLEPVREFGLPSYFDDQRFGNLRHNQGWIAHELIRGRVEGGLKRLLTAVSDHDDPRERGFKSAVYRKWGDWRTCRDIAGKFGRHHSVFEHLRRHPTDFAGAFKHVSSRLRLIHLYAFQSHLWNRALADHLERSADPRGRFTVRGREGKLLFPKRAVPVPAAWEGILPLPGPRLEGVELPDQIEIYTRVLAAMGLTPADLDVQGVPGFQLKPEPRTVVVRPEDLRAHPPEPDADHPGRHLVRLSFRLPRGSYATLVVRRLIGPPKPLARRPAPRE